MFLVNMDKCIGCGLCAYDCSREAIEIKNKKAIISNDLCFKCGHCIAVCPQNAVYTDEYNMDDVVDFTEVNNSIDAETLLNFIKARRTIRHFKKKEVEIEKLKKIIEAGRFTATAGNGQSVRYIIVKENKEKLRLLLMKSLYESGLELMKNEKGLDEKTKRYAARWIKFYEDYQKDNNAKDYLFFDASALILVVTNNPIDGGLAASNMELMTYSLGLGMFYSGFFVRGCNHNDEMRKYLKLAKGENVIACLGIGYPDIKFYRNAPRKTASITVL